MGDIESIQVSMVWMIMYCMQLKSYGNGKQWNSSCPLAPSIRYSVV